MDEKEQPAAESTTDEPIEDLTPEKDPTAGGPHVRVFSGRDASLDAQKKEIDS